MPLNCAYDVTYMHAFPVLLPSSVCISEKSWVYLHRVPFLASAQLTPLLSLLLNTAVAAAVCTGKKTKKNKKNYVFFFLVVVGLRSLSRLSPVGRTHSWRASSSEVWRSTRSGSTRPSTARRRWAFSSWCFLSCDWCLHDGRAEKWSRCREN